MSNEKVNVLPGKGIIAGRFQFPGGTIDQLTTDKFPILSIILQNPSKDDAGATLNTSPIVIYDSAAAQGGIIILPGDSVVLDVASPDLVYVAGAFGEWVFWNAVLA